MTEMNAVYAIGQLLAQHGAEAGIANVSTDGDNDSAEVIFDFEGESLVISSSGRFEVIDVTD